MIIAALVIVFLALAFWLYLVLNPQFGGSVNEVVKKEYARSDQWNGKIFENRSETNMDIGLKTMPGLLKAQFTNRQVREPRQPIAIKPLDVAALQAEPEKPKFVWYGHSAVLLQVNGKNLLIDPMLGDNASPIAPFATKRFSQNALDVIDTLPPLDAVLMTHDHYDHLDYASFKKLKGKTDRFLVALGVSRHLKRWGFDSTQITEFDWWQSIEFEGIKLTFTPSRHFSGRGLSDRAKSLWGGWVIKTESHNIYWSGDGGYDDHFKEIGEKYGPFDWGFMECGQYNELWRAIHMFPDEAVKAALETGVKQAIPVHWCGFALALHTWKHPIENFVSTAEELQQPICTPQIGEVVVWGEESRKAWWEPLD